MTHQAKKSLGQNFLKSEQALNTMCTVSDLNIDDVVLEIGPGKGALTKKLLEKAGQVIAIEKDFELISILQEKFHDEIKKGKLILSQGDILDFEIKNYKIKNYKIIANIPYNITGAILKKFLSTNTKPTSMTLLVQKEVAERVVARDKKESILSISVKAYGDPTYIMKVHKRFFTPSPKVDSAIVLIKNISTEKFKSTKEEEIFFQIIKTGFLHKRKILKKNLAKFSLAESPNISNEMFRESLKDSEVGLPNIIDKIWDELNLDPKIRAESVPLSTWLSITNYFSTNL
jgi:16S rRNA (adenine1518-N6/adenine1519-N6)-dimethyltransferase